MSFANLHLHSTCSNAGFTPEQLALKPKYPSAVEVIRIVRKAGGVIALAHPAPHFTAYIE